MPGAGGGQVKIQVGLRGWDRCRGGGKACMDSNSESLGRSFRSSYQLGKATTRTILTLFKGSGGVISVFHGFNFPCPWQ